MTVATDVGLVLHCTWKSQEGLNFLGSRRARSRAKNAGKPSLSPMLAAPLARNISSILWHASTPPRALPLAWLLLGPRPPGSMLPPSWEELLLLPPPPPPSMGSHPVALEWLGVGWFTGRMWLGPGLTGWTRVWLQLLASWSCTRFH